MSVVLHEARRAPGLIFLKLPIGAATGVAAADRAVPDRGNSGRSRAARRGPRRFAKHPLPVDPDIERPKWQAADALPPGRHIIVFDWKMDTQGPPLGRGGTGTLSIDGKQVVQRSLPKTQPLPCLSTSIEIT